MQQQDTLNEAIANVLTSKAIQMVPEPLKSLLKEQRKLTHKAKSDLAANNTREQLLRSHAATQQLLDALNIEIRNLKSEITSANVRNDVLQKRNEVLTWVSIVLGFISILLGIFAFFI